MKRRFFLGASMMAAGSALAQTSGTPSERVRLGMIGVGGRGRGLLGSFAKLDDVEVRYLCDVDQASLERASKVVTDTGMPRPNEVADMRRVLDDPDVDAVVVATPDHWHAPATILACQAGKDVYVEKPASHNIREGRLMVDAARRYNRIVQVGTQARNRISTVEGVQAAKSGEIGDVLMAKAWNIQLRDDIGHKEDSPVPDGVDYDGWLGPAPWIPFNENRFHYKWHWHWHFGTGDAGNDGAHQIDIARWALGEDYPVAASGTARKIYFDDDQQTPDTMNITFDYEDKAMIWEMRIWSPYKMEDVDNGVAVYGTKGSVHIGRWNREWGYKVFNEGGEQVRHVPERVGDSPHHTDFIEAVKSRRLPNADILVGHLSAIHCHLANIVARTGRNLRFDRETETVVDDAQANLYVSRRYRTHWSTPQGV